MSSGPVLAPATDQPAPRPRIVPSGRGSVVVGHDGPGAADHALRRGAALASQLGDRLVVVRACPTPDDVDASVVDLDRDVVRVLGHHVGLDVGCRVEVATPVHALTAVADRADMLVLGSHEGAGGRHHDHPGSVSRRCMRDASCPVLLVGPERVHARPAPQPDPGSGWAPSAHQVEVLVTAGTLAPSMHNTQPWTFWTSGADLLVGLDPDRMLPVEDPSTRAAVLSIGAVVTNVRCQAAADDLGTDVTWLPVSDDGPVAGARVHLDPVAPADHELALLAPSIANRRTRRRPMSGRPVAPATEALLVDAAATEGALLVPLDRPGERDALADLVHEADELDAVDDDRSRERARWSGGERTADGIPERSFGQRDTSGATVRDFAPGVRSAVRGWARFEQDAPLYLLGTERDDEIGWLRAGAALEHLWLVATARGLAMSFLNQVLERDDLRLRVRAVADDRLWPHMVVRLGYGDPPVATPRRPWSTFLR